MTSSTATLVYTVFKMVLMRIDMFCCIQVVIKDVTNNYKDVKHCIYFISIFNKSWVILLIIISENKNIYRNQSGKQYSFRMLSQMKYSPCYGEHF